MNATTSATGGLPADLDGRLLRCTSCAACRTGCPTFDATLREGHGGRGRVLLAHGLVRGELAPEPRLREYLGACTRCGFCEDVCPVDVPVRDLVGRARRAVEDALGRAPVWSRLIAAWEGEGADETAVAAALGVAAVPLEARDEPEDAAADLLVGCRVRHLAPELLPPTFALLDRIGVRVRVRSAGPCNGYLPEALGRSDLAARQGAELGALLGGGSTPVLTLCAGCRSHPAGERLHVDAAELLLDELEASGALDPSALEGPVAVHAPCQDRHTGRPASFGARLAKLGVAVLDVPQPACCGGAHPAVDEHPDLMRALAEPWLKELLKRDVRTLITSDPGCLHHFRRVAAAHGPSVLHAIEAVAALA